MFASLIVLLLTQAVEHVSLARTCHTHLLRACHSAAPFAMTWAMDRSQGKAKQDKNKYKGLHDIASLVQPCPSWSVLLLVWFCLVIYMFNLNDASNL